MRSWMVCEKRGKMENKNKSVHLDELTKNDIIVVKRGKRSEEIFSDQKLSRYLMYGANGDEVLVNEVLRDVRVKLNKKIKVQDITTAVLRTVSSKISRIAFDKWDAMARRLYLLDMLHSAYDVKNNEYPHLKDVIDKGVKYKVYDKLKARSYTADEIDELNVYIDPDRDSNFPFSALLVFNKKYCKSLKKKKIELPQHTYMRVAMGVSYKMTGRERIDFVKFVYDMLSYKVITVGTPGMNNALTTSNQYASCVLSTLANTTFDISNKIKTAMLYTKHQGGLGFDMSHIQSKGSSTSNGTTASGIVPYIKDFEQAVQSMMQSDTRRGSAVITYSWWGYDVFEFAAAKQASGTEENTAKHLQYTLSTHKYFTKAVKEDRDIYLMCPKDAASLLYLTGDEFEVEYERLCELKTVRKRKVKAKEVFKAYYVTRFETGNMYRMFIDNANPNMTNRPIMSSNLCMEVFEPSRPAKFISEDIVVTNGKLEYNTRFEDEETALCNLASVNMDILRSTFSLPSPFSSVQSIFDGAVKLLDNMIEIGNYPRASGKYTNDRYRYIGLGVSNKAYAMAKDHVRFDSYESLEWTYKMFQKYNNYSIRASAKLAKERGRFDGFYETKWADGVLPYDLGNDKLKTQFAYLHDQEMEDETREMVEKWGVRNALLNAIAPTASSGNAAGLLPGTLPIAGFDYVLEGVISTNVIVPEFKTLNQYYVDCWSIKPEINIMHAGIHQLWLDQGSSQDVWMLSDDWTHSRGFQLEELAEDIGVKSLYYLNTKKNEIHEVCESCSS